MIFGCRAGKLRCVLVWVTSCATTTWMWAAQVTPNLRDTLTYKDGDRVQGVLVEQTEEIIVFKSDRFGELRISAKDAVVIKAEKPVAGGAKTAPQTTPVAP